MKRNPPPFWTTITCTHCNYENLIHPQDVEFRVPTKCKGCKRELVFPERKGFWKQATRLLQLLLLSIISIILGAMAIIGGLVVIAIFL